jgi:hypothetical protein
MTIEQQVTSLELAKRLKELGVKQNGLFCWNESISGKTKPYIGNGTAIRKNEISAFTVAELGEMLPMEIKNRNGKYDGKYFETTRIAFKNWTVSYTQGKKLIVQVLGKTEADARAKMLIHLIENNLL